MGAKIRANAEAPNENKGREEHGGFRASLCSGLQHELTLQLLQITAAPSSSRPCQFTSSENPAQIQASHFQKPDVSLS